MPQVFWRSKYVSACICMDGKSNNKICEGPQQMITKVNKHRQKQARRCLVGPGHSSEKRHLEVPWEISFIATLVISTRPTPSLLTCCL